MGQGSGAIRQRTRGPTGDRTPIRVDGSPLALAHRSVTETGIRSKQQPIRPVVPFVGRGARPRPDRANHRASRPRDANPVRGIQSR
jgi:hypothetical protein